MKQALTWGGLLVVMMGTMGAVGANPRYIEELAIGGGYGDTPDGGAWIDKTGAFTTDTSVTANGNGAFGKNEGVNHSVSVTAGSSEAASTSTTPSSARLRLPT